MAILNDNVTAYSVSFKSEETMFTALREIIAQSGCTARLDDESGYYEWNGDPASDDWWIEEDHRVLHFRNDSVTLSYYCTNPPEGSTIPSCCNFHVCLCPEKGVIPCYFLTRLTGLYRALGHGGTLEETWVDEEKW